jgi:two-component system cell cycle sensor histidine kinase/response regulator CckA
VTGPRLPDGVLAALTDDASDAIVLVDADGRVQYVNQAARDLFGYEGDELIGVAVERLIPGRLRRRHVGDRSAYSAQPSPRPMGLGLRLEGLRRDGSEVAVEISLAPVGSGPGRAVLAVVRDATEQRRLEAERVRYAHAHAVAEIVDSLDAIVWESATADRESLTYLGGRDEMLLGYPRARWLEAGFSMSLVHPEDRVATLAFVETAQQQDSFELSYRVIAADGTVREVRDAVTVTRGPGGRVERLRGVITDVTDRRELADRLAQAQKMEAVGQLAGGIAHDFNNLLTIVSGYARRLIERPDLAGAHADLEQIVTAADRAGELTRQLLAFARRGQSMPTLQPPSGVLRELEPMLRRLLSADIVFDFRLADGVPDVHIDRTAFEQIIMNLMLNAADAMPAGGTLTVASDTRAVAEHEAARHGAAPGSYVRISVSDTGTGIAPAILERMFEPFFSTKGDRGNGMGLATVVGTVDQAGGWIDVESVVGEGTTFSVILPAAGEGVESGAEAPSRTTLLVVEDEPALRALAVTMLEEQGYPVLQAGNGRDAIVVAERHGGEIDLLLTDVVMPGLSGPELAQHLRVLCPGLEVLFMSGYSDSRLVSSGIDQTAVNLLLKPFTPDELIGRVAQLTEREPR